MHWDGILSFGKFILTKWSSWYVTDLFDSIWCKDLYCTEMFLYFSIWSLLITSVWRFSKCFWERRDSGACGLLISICCIYYSQCDIPIVRDLLWLFVLTILYSLSKLHYSYCSNHIAPIVQITLFPLSRLHCSYWSNTFFLLFKFLCSYCSNTLFLLFNLHCS